MEAQDPHMDYGGWDGTYLYVGGGFLYVVDMVEPELESYVGHGDLSIGEADAGLCRDMPIGEAYVEYISPDYVLHKCGFIPYYPEETLRSWCEKNELPIPWEKVSDSIWDEMLNYVS